jgi:hypothetical protein
MSAAVDGTYGTTATYESSPFRRFAPNAVPRWGSEMASGSRILSLVAR